MQNQLKRREFITVIGSAAAWPLAARAQQPVPVIGFLGVNSPEPLMGAISVFRRELAAAGYIEGQNILIDYRFAQGRYDRLPGLAADLVRRQVSVIVTGVTSQVALAAKSASSTIPIVFGVSEDPTKLGLVASLARPGGNATGVNILISELGAKQLGLLRELVPTVTRVSLLLNPTNSNHEPITKDVIGAASTMGLQIEVLHARDREEIESAFASLKRNRAEALLVGADALFFNRRIQIVTLTTRLGIPAIYNLREYAEAGGLMSYGTNLGDAYRQLGIYTSRILNGAKPADLPVVQSTTFELVINLPTAKALEITVPPMLIARADEVIE
jgi:putative ABC transport system substrate-binding protein